MLRFGWKATPDLRSSSFGSCPEHVEGLDVQYLIAIELLKKLGPNNKSLLAKTGRDFRFSPIHFGCSFHFWSMLNQVARLEIGIIKKKAGILELTFKPDVISFSFD
jgi:hypothetical protein